MAEFCESDSIVVANGLHACGWTEDELKTEGKSVNVVISSVALTSLGHFSILEIT